MLIAFGVVFVGGVAGMAVVLLRHLPEVQRAVTEGEELPLNSESNSIARAYITRMVDRFDAWVHWNAREDALKFLDRILKIFERTAGRVAGETKQVRLMIQERFRVIPRESLYWKQINAWKKTNGNGNGGGLRREYVLAEEDGDVSNHL